MKKHPMLRWIQNLSMQKKLSLIIIFCCGVLLAGHYLVLQMVYHAYDEQLYIKTAQTFTSYADRIEIELEKLDTVTLSMIGDEAIQSKLTVLRDGEVGSVEWMEAISDASSLVKNYQYNTNVFSQMCIYPAKDTNRIVGSHSGLSEEDMKMLAEKAAEGKGASRIVVYEGQVYFVRLIRESKNFAFTPLGTIIGEINIQKLLKTSEELNRVGDLDLDISIYVQEACVYQSDEAMEPLVADGWEIQGDNFVVQCTSARGWKFLMHTPYGEIHDAVRVITINSLLIYVCVAVVVLLISHSFVVRIMRHLDTLMDKFDAYGKGILPGREEMMRYVDRKDEIGRLHRHFDRMTYEYKQLNDENYNRMLSEKEAQYKLLQQQIHPHFIFNTLSLIAWTAYDQKDNKVVRITNALSRMMRKSLSFSEKTITVKEELELVEDYMLIQRERYGERLKFELTVPPELEKVQIPQMTIQPIVENAVKYALEEMLEPCVIRVWGRREDERVILIVEDNGEGIDEDIIHKLATGEKKADGNGIGLQNIQKRIQFVFSDQYGLEFHRIEERTQVWICLPLNGEEQEKKNV